MIYICFKLNAVRPLLIYCLFIVIRRLWVRQFYLTSLSFIATSTSQKFENLTNEAFYISKLLKIISKIFEKDD